jgi:hypothetical protein
MGKDKAQAGSVVPTFYSLAGEPIPIPKKFLGLLKAAVRGTNCPRCTHSHYLLRPKAAAAALAVTVAAKEPASVVSTDTVLAVPISSPPIETTSEGHGLEVEAREMPSALSAGSQEE